MQSHQVNGQLCSDRDGLLSFLLRELSDFLDCPRAIAARHEPRLDFFSGCLQQNDTGKLELTKDCRFYGQTLTGLAAQNEMSIEQQVNSGVTDKLNGTD